MLYAIIIALYLWLRGDKAYWLHTHPADDPAEDRDLAECQLIDTAEHIGTRIATRPAFV